MGKLAVIGGSGLYKLEGVANKGQEEVETPFGAPSAPVMRLEVEGCPFLFLPRHGIGHHTPPSEVNYRANIWALKSLGVDTVVSVSAVGSLQEQYAPRQFVLPDQFIDWTKGQRKRSFFDEGMVGHVSCAQPVELGLQARIHQACLGAGVSAHLGGTYVCIEGPQFSSKAESRVYRSFGASVIGMTNVPEAYLAKEAGMAYATVAMVTDYDCWRDAHCEVQEIMAVMKDNYVSAQKLLRALVPSLTRDPVAYTPEHKYALITDQAKLSARHREILAVVLK